MEGRVLAIFISPVAQQPMRSVPRVRAIAGAGLEGDRYASGEGSYNKGKVGKRQVTLINASSFNGTTYEYSDSRRNIVVQYIELMPLIDKVFQVGTALMRGVKYCDPCGVPTELSSKEEDFGRTFFERGGLVAEVIEDGLIEVGDAVIPPSKASVERQAENRAQAARLAWSVITSLLGLHLDTSLENVFICLETGSSLKIAAVQFIVLGSGWSVDGLAATGLFDIHTNGPSLNRLYGAAGGSTHR